MNERYLNFGKYALVFLLCLAFLSVYFSDVILHPSQYLLTDSGDGFKNIFVFIWHIIHDNELFQTNSMNYPFGESIFYVDAQPFFSIPLQLINSINNANSSTWLGVLNYLVVLSIPLSSLLSYRILKEYGTPFLPALFLSIGIVLNAPLINRMSNHFGLSYIWILLLSVLFLILFQKHRKQKFLILLSITILIGFLIHPYQGLIVLALSLIILLIDTSFRNPKKAIKTIAIRTAIVIMPMILFLVLTKLVDHHPGRVTHPYGFFEYVSSLKGLFLPINTDFPSLLSVLNIGKHGTGEDFNYLGISGIILFGLSLVYLIMNRNKSNFQSQFFCS